MTSSFLTRAVVLGLASGIAIPLAAKPSNAQLDVTGGGATINNADVFVPTNGNITGTNPGTDTRAVVTQGTFDAVTIQTNQGNLPTSAVFRPNTLPTINNGTGLGGDLQNSTGTVLGTVSFQGVGPLGPQFFNIPTTLNFQVANSVGLAGGTNISEFRAVGYILQETGFVTAANGIGVVQRRTPVTLVQYGGPTQQTVLGNVIPQSAYSSQRDGQTFNGVGPINLEFQSGTVFTPTGFTLGGFQEQQAQQQGLGFIFDQSQQGRSQITSISIFNQVALIDLPDFDDIIFDDDADGIPNEDDDDFTDDVADDDSDDVADNDDDDNDDDDDDDGDDDDDDDGGVIGDGGSSDDGTTADDGGLIGALPDTGDGSSDDGGGVDDGGDSGDDDSDDDDGDDDDDDDGDDDDDDDDGGVVTHPNDGGDQFSPILPRFVFIGIFVFTNVPSGRWVDPPMADGFEYEMTARDVPVGTPSRVFPGMTGVGQADDSVFTRISGFPIDVDADDTFVVSVDGIVLGEFSPGDTLRFSDYADALGDRLVDGGVRKFTISEINPAVNTRDPIAFPLQLDFNTNTASFEMRALEAAPNGETTRISSATQ
jgi:hypothetical protein